MKIIFLILYVLLAGCASKTYQTKELLNTQKPTTASSKQLQVPFYLQEQYYCGPATLAMMLEYKGKDINVNEIQKMSFTPNSKGTYQTDMLSTVRRHGFLGIPVNNMTSLVKEVADNNPVLVFRNLGFSWYSLWHYSIVTGFDLKEQSLTEHSGDKSNSIIPMKHFERSWNRGGYWGLIVLEPGEISSTATLEQHLEATAGLEQLQMWDKARKSYKQLEEKWPNSGTINYGLGNIAFHAKDFSRAEMEYLKAIEKEPTLAFAWHNLALTQKSLNKISLAKKSAAKAVELAPLHHKEQFQINLKGL